MKTHELKTWPEYFQKVLNGSKNFELRLNDRDFKVGDILRLKEWDKDLEKYTGRQTTREVTYIFEGQGFGISEGYCIMSLTK